MPNDIEREQPQREGESDEAYIDRLYIPQCDCESNHCQCNHKAGACPDKPTVKVTMFGFKANLCPACLVSADASGEITNKVSL